RDDAGRALHVLHDQGRLPWDETNEMPRHDPRRRIDSAAWRKADDHRQGLALVEIGCASTHTGYSEPERATHAGEDVASCEGDTHRAHADACSAAAIRSTRPPAWPLPRYARPPSCRRDRAIRNAGIPSSRV